ncbi:hypothetical protein CANTEDRAFT_121459 [Yamadazyma tenuis ATCC 10573]|uniref:Uncharacterized protein n=2 Tax=Candida tenuis TaxID=2315449 RepID=G3B468_CANTC|nr:uncharacterized protein CANTEDRAFT_121459 [Yamadazyma tenuis ATCC 10573]EGV63789.1 hypothetical protein CANTEDRAFT_121459 [Yamadazyma tenuis ATCC 10573]
MGVCKGLVIDRSVISEFAGKISLKGLKDIKVNLENELKSLTSPMRFSFSNTTVEVSKNSEDFIILPPDLVSSDIYEKLGLEFLNEDGYKFKLFDKDLMIPKDFKTLFLYNTSTPLSIPTSKHDNLAKFIDESLPFNLPPYMNLINHYLVLPRSYLNEKLKTSGEAFETLAKLSSMFSRGILISSSSYLPIFRAVMSENVPFMVFMFSDSTIDKFEEQRNPIMTVKNYLGTEKNIISNFFDTFAENWINNINYDSLISSVFCTTNSNNLTDSYCLKIRDKNALLLFPAFYEVSQLLNFEEQEPQLMKRADEPLAEAQVVRQVHNRLSNYAEKFNDVSYEFATEPKQLIERVDERLDQKSYKFFDKIDEKTDNIADKKDSLVHQVADKVRMIKGSLDFKELFNEDYDTKESDYDVDGDNLMGKRTVEEEEDNLFEYQQEEGIVLPLSLVRVEEYSLSSPRHKKFSQVLFEDTDDNEHTLSKRFTIFSTDEDCEKITWYKVFHYSIFGKPRFCLSNY